LGEESSLEPKVAQAGTQADITNTARKKKTALAKGRRSTISVDVACRNPRRTISGGNRGGKRCQGPMKVDLEVSREAFTTDKFSEKGVRCLECRKRREMRKTLYVQTEKGDRGFAEWAKTSKSTERDWGI